MVRRGGIRAVGRVGALYSALVAGSVVFSIPFVWLLLSSFKTNEELFLDPPRWVPRRPAATAASPYVARDEFALVRPKACPRWRWPELREALLGAVRQRVSEVLSAGARAHGEALAAEVAEGVAFKAAESVRDDLWFQSQETVVAGCLRHVSRSLVATCGDKALKRFLIGPVRVKSIEQEEVTLREDEPIHAVWSVVGGELREAKGEGRRAALVAYRFDRRCREVRLSAVFPLAFPVGRMRKLNLSLHPDQSWHALYLELEAEGRRWRSRRPFYAASNTWQEQVWQFPGPDDRSLKVKSWIVLEPAGRSDFAQPGAVRITLRLVRQSRGGAWLAKLANNFRWAFRYMPFWRYTAVSFFLCAMNILGQLVGSSLAAYAFARLRWPGRDFCFMLLLGTLMVPAAVTMVPSFLIFKTLGWYNKLLVLWVPSFCGSAFNIFLLRQFMRSIPTDLEDAARIDGCSFFGVYRHVILPSIRPALAAIAIFTFMGTWNNFMGPLIFLSDQSKYPLALGIFGLQTQAGGNFGLIMAASALMALPVVVMFFFCQRYFIQGITLTGMKG